MTQDEIEAVRAELVEYDREVFGTMAANALRLIDHLTTRLSEVERERDEARALNTGFAMTLDEDRQDHEEEEQHLRAKVTELEAEVARLTKERDELAQANHRQAHALQLTAQALGSNCSFSCDAMPKAATRVARERDEAKAGLAELVIAAREAWEMHGQSGDDLDRALMRFAERVPYSDQPEENLS